MIKVMDEGTEREQIVMTGAGCPTLFFWLDHSAMAWRYESSSGHGRQKTVGQIVEMLPEMKEHIIRRTRELLLAQKGLVSSRTRQLASELLTVERA